MICPKCSSRNRKRANFCDQCGTRLRVVCSRCENGNRLGARFCDRCGTRLDAPGKGEPPARPVAVPEPRTLPERLPSAEPESRPSAEPAQGGRSGLAQFITDDFAAKLEAARIEKAMYGERRVVTILFCDVVGSTAAASRLDPEEWAEIMNGVFEVMIQPVYKYEGIVARLMGDAILAFFGAPIAHEDDPQRAILAGLEIVQGMSSYRETLAKNMGTEIDLRVGINTGLVMVGQVGTDLQMEYTALGDAINLAARMEQTAQPGSVQVSEHTYRLVAPLFEFEDLGEVELKGRAEPMRVYRAVRQKERMEKRRGLQGLESRFIGREAETGRLLAGYEDLRHGLGKIVFVVAEAGLGKSRLIQEFKAGLDDPAVTWYEAASLSYETRKPYGLFQHLFRQAWNIDTTEAAEETRERLASLVQELPIEDETAAQMVFELLAGVQASPGSGGLEGEALKRRIAAGVLDFWRYKASQSPTVLVFDDLHWSDAASVELLRELFRLTDELPVMLICALRPDRDSPGWQARQEAQDRFPHRFSEIDLKPLTVNESAVLVTDLLHIEDLPEALSRRILQKTDGNPFFIEEVIRTLIDRGAIVSAGAQDGNGSGGWRVVETIAEVDLPENLLSLLVARIDHLDEQTRRTLQLAAVIGRSFYQRILEAILRSQPAQIELDRELLRLQRADLIREVARMPEIEYIFRHSLMQEAAYHTILLKERREYHARVGAAIEQLFAGRLEEFYPILAFHFGQAGEPRALDYEIRSGDAAFRLFAIPEAQAHYDNALRIAREQPEKVDPATWNHLYTRRGRVLELQANYADAVRNYEVMEAHARREKDAKLEMNALLALATVLAIPTPVQNTQKAIALSERNLSLARQMEDRAVEAKVLWTFQILNNYSGQMRAGIPYGEQSVALARAEDLTEQLAHSLHDLALPYMATGNLAAARQVIAEAGEMWREQENYPMQAENMAFSVHERLLTGRIAESIAQADECEQLSRKIGNEWGQINSQTFANIALLAQGKIDQALENLQSRIPVASRIGHPGGLLQRGQLAWVYRSTGDYEEAERVLKELEPDSKAFPPFHGFTLAGIAKILLIQGGLTEASTRLAEVSQHSRQGTMLFIDAAVELAAGEMLLAEGAFQEAAGHAQGMVDKMRAYGAHFYLPEALHLKARALAAQERLEEAVSILEEAQGIAWDQGSRTAGWRILADLAWLESQRNRDAEAQGWREKAREMAGFIAGSIGDDARRARFSELVEARLAEPGNIILS